MNNPTTIEQTGKRYKGRMLAGTIVAGVGIGIMFGVNEGMGPAVGLITTLAGFGIYGWARFMAWWNHG